MRGRSYQRRWLRGSGAIAAGVLAVSILPGLVLAGEPGDLDPNFSRDGVKQIDFGRWDYAEFAFVDSLGRITVAGTRGNAPPYKIAMARLLPDGRLDTKFGTGGKRVIDPPGDGPAAAWSQTPDGRLVAYGGLDGPRYFLMQFRRNGRIDRTFGGGDGIVVGRFPGRYSAMDMVVEPSGRIVVLGSAGNETFIKAHDARGTRDRRFGDGGLATVAGSSSTLLHHPSGRVLVAGLRRERRLVIDALREDGTRDTSYGRRGRASVELTVGPDEDLSDPVAAVLADGDVALATDSFENFSTDLLIARFTSDGTPSASFGGGDGWRRFDVSEVDVPLTIAPLRNGGMVIGGFVGDGFFDHEPSHLLLVGLRADGQRWRSFGSNGVVRNDLGIKGTESTGASAAWHAIAVGQHLVVAGHGGRDAVVARFEANGRHSRH